MRRLPAYSPDFNPDEASWAWAREEVTANTCLGTKAMVQEKMADFFRRLAPYLKPYPFQIVEIMVYLLFAVGFGLALQGSQKFLIDNVIGPPAPDGAMLLLGQLLAALGIAFVINALASLRRSYLTAWVSDGKTIVPQHRQASMETSAARKA